MSPPTPPPRSPPLDQGEVTVLLGRINDDRRAADQLVSLVYWDLHDIALRYMKQEREDHTLGATGLVHEAYLRLVGQQQPDWKSRAQFFAMAATAMRRILCDGARARKSKKRGSGIEPVTLSAVSPIVEEDLDEVLAVDEALTTLAEVHPRQAKVVELRYFAGMSFEEIAAVLGKTSRTLKEDWRIARIWLVRHIGNDT